MTLPAERFDLTPIQSMGDSGQMFDFEYLEAKSPREASIEVPIDYRVEDAHERFRIAELRIVQENVKKIEADGDDGGDAECPYLDRQFSDTEDDNSTNAPYVPGCRTEEVRVRNRVRHRQQPDLVPSCAWLEPEEKTAPIREDASRVVLLPADEAGEAEPQEEPDRPILAASDSTTRAPLYSPPRVRSRF